jgi:hypothetical protein
MASALMNAIIAPHSSLRMQPLVASGDERVHFPGQHFAAGKPLSNPVVAIGEVCRHR